MVQLKRIGCLCLVFLAGGVVFANLLVMVYGSPEHYHANWGKVIFALLLAVYFGYCAIHPDRQMS